MTPKLVKGIARKFKDDRGSLMNVPLQEIFDAVGVPDFRICHHLISHSEPVGTFRGFHYQMPPFAQTKIVVIESGRLTDYILPLGAEDFSEVQSFEMEEGDVLLVPNTFAHGFVTTTPDLRMHYLMDQVFSASHYAGINGVEFARSVTAEDITISEKDKNLPRINGEEG